MQPAPTRDVVVRFFFVAPDVRVFKMYFVRVAFVLCWGEKGWTG